MAAGEDRTEILRLAESPAWDERAEAGSRLAALAGDPEIDTALDRLLLDPNDTGVTLRTAEALLSRCDLPGLRVFVRAWDRADLDTGNWLGDSTYSVRQSIEDQTALMGRLLVLADGDADASVQTGAAGVLQWLDRN